jgi:hypothetical protein
MYVSEAADMVFHDDQLGLFVPFSRNVGCCWLMRFGFRQL